LRPETCLRQIDRRYRSTHTQTLANAEFELGQELHGGEFVLLRSGVSNKSENSGPKRCIVLHTNCAPQRQSGSQEGNT